MNCGAGDVTSNLGDLLAPPEGVTSPLVRLSDARVVVEIDDGGQHLVRCFQSGAMTDLREPN